MADLTTLANVKLWLSSQSMGTTSDAFLQLLITSCSTFVQSWLNRTIALTSYADTFNGQGNQRLILPNAPVVDVTSLTVNGQAIPQRTPLGSGTGWGWVFDDQSVMLCGYCFNRGFQNVAVSYTAGYASTPADIEQAVIEIIVNKFRERDRFGLKSNSIEGQTVVYNLSDLPPTALLILQQYRKVVPS